MAPQKLRVLGQLSHCDKKTTLSAAGLYTEVYFLYSSNRLFKVRLIREKHKPFLINTKKKKSCQKFSLQINVVQRQKVLWRAPSRACKGSRTCFASWIQSWDFCPCTHSSPQTPSGVQGMEIPQFPALGLMGASQCHQHRTGAGAELSTGRSGASGTPRTWNYPWE